MDRFVYKLYETFQNNSDEQVQGYISLRLHTTSTVEQKMFAVIERRINLRCGNEIDETILCRNNKPILWKASKSRCCLKLHTKHGHLPQYHHGSIPRLERVLEYLAGNKMCPLFRTTWVQCSRYKWLLFVSSWVLKGRIYNAKLTLVSHLRTSQDSLWGITTWTGNLFPIRKEYNVLPSCTSPPGFLVCKPFQPMGCAIYQSIVE